MERIWENRRTTDNWDLGDFLPFTLSIREVCPITWGEAISSTCLSPANLYFDEINNAYFILRVYIVGLFASEMNGMSRKKLLGIVDKILILPSRDRLFVYS